MRGNAQTPFPGKEAAFVQKRVVLSALSREEKKSVCRAETNGKSTVCARVCVRACKGLCICQIRLAPSPLIIPLSSPYLPHGFGSVDNVEIEH